MTARLTSNSPRRVAAAQFGAELRRAMAARKVSALQLAPAAGVAKSAIAMWRGGNNLPRVDTATRVAEVLQWPRLAEIAAQGRSGTCETCGRPFTNQGGSPKRYCTPECAGIAAQLRGPTPAQELARVVADGLENGRPFSWWDDLERALAVYRAGEAQRARRVDLSARRIAVLQSAVDAFCRSCEPEGVCRTMECPLRPASPLPTPLDPERRTTAVQPREGAWGPSNAPRMITAIREANARRWGRDGGRERASETMRARHAALTPDERAALGERISAGRRRVTA